jgi:actin-related protein 3
MGFAGNSEPQYIIPSCIATKTAANETGLSDLDFWIGDEAFEHEAGGKTRPASQIVL